MARKKSHSGGKKRKGRKGAFFSFSFRIALIICAIPLLLCYLSIFIDPEVLPIFAVFGVYYLPIVLINVILLIIAAIKRSASFWISFIILLPTLFFTDSLIQFDGNKKSEGEGIMLMTYNVGRFTASKDGLSIEKVQKKVSDFIAEEKPDIIALQEFRVADTNKIATMYPQYPYIQKFLLKYRHGQYFAGNMILSKYPIAGGKKIAFKGSTNMAIFSDINVKGNVIRVYNLHLESNSISMTSLIKKMKGNYEDFSNEFVDANEKVLNSSLRRTKQVKYILEHIENSKKNALICGDVNDTPVSFCFRKLSEGRKDTFKESGRGFGATYSVLWPLLRIDYVFVPEYFNVFLHKTLKVKYSDHYPVITKFTIDHDR